MGKKVCAGFVLLFIILPLVLRSEPLGAQDLYMGKRWGFSQLTATPVDHVAWSPDGKYIFFTIVGDQKTYIYRIRDIWKIVKGKTLPGDLKVDRIMEVQGRITDFSFAHGRMAAAYSIPEGTFSGLYIANMATCETKKVAEGKMPRWDPFDRKVLFYYRSNNGVYGLAQINIDGSNRETLSESSDWGGEWSADGKMIAFLSSRGFSAGTTNLSNIFVKYFNPPSIKQVSHDVNSYQKNLSWSPRGKRLVFETFNGVEVIDITNFQRKLVIPRGDYFTSHEFTPFFSPDGRWIFYRREMGVGIYQIYTQEEVTVEGSIPWDHFALSPDGRKLCFSVSKKRPRRGLWVVEAFDF